MFGLSVKITDTTTRVQRAAERGAFRSFARAAYAIMLTARASIDTAPQGEASEPGDPPHTHRRMYLRRALRYSANKHGAVIGAAHSIVGTAGQPHEHGGRYKGGDYPDRPFMAPALAANLPRFAGSWTGSIAD